MRRAWVRIFLTDKGVIDSIIEATNISEEDLIIEIGPGVGVLTVEAAKEAGKVCAIEIDKNLLPVLDFTLKGYDNIEVINQDVLKTDLNDIIKSSKFQHTKVIGNLPYYITTPIIMYLLENEINIESITIMMQKEVADRIMQGQEVKLLGLFRLQCNITARSVRSLRYQKRYSILYQRLILQFSS